MKAGSKKKLLGLLVFSAMAGFVFTLFYYVYSAEEDPRIRRHFEKNFGLPQQKADRPRIEDDHIKLMHNQPLTFKKFRLGYHGIKENLIHLSIYILDLDPSKAYHYKIPIKEAQKGFQLAGHNFKLGAYEDSKIDLIQTWIE